AAVNPSAAVFPSPALPGSGSRGPGPHPVLRIPPPTTTGWSIHLRFPLFHLRRLAHQRVTLGVVERVDGETPRRVLGHLILCSRTSNSRAVHLSKAAKT